MPEVRESTNGVITSGMLAGVTRELVRLYASHYGKGPTKARSYQNDDSISCLMQDTLTPAEITLKERGKGDAVVQMRHAFQSAMEEEFGSIVERETSRRVVGFMSQVTLEPDAAIEVFLLEEAT